MPFAHPSSEELAKYRAEYARRQRIFLGTAFGGFLVWIPVMIGAGDSDWIRFAYLATYLVIVLVVGLSVWRCPRCDLIFGRAWRVRRCPVCGLELEESSQPAA
jgi:rubrerythrin